VNETKLLHVTKSYTLRPATEEEIRKIGSEPGFISAVGLEKKVIVVADLSLRKVRNAYTGANKKHKDLINVNIGRDFLPEYEADIALAKAGYIAPNGKTLIEKRGVEVGNIFQLGYHYSSKMKGAVFVDEDGLQKPFYMGCYGIGLARTLGTVVEKYHDDKGIVWPKALSPFAVHLIHLSSTDTPGVSSRADRIYKALLGAGFEVLHDDRVGVSAGAKFADADLIGIPVRLVISPKTGEKIEWKLRTKKETELVSLEEVLERLKK
jgi:prolyl-tRNA synthetase